MKLCRDGRHYTILRLCALADPSRFSPGINIIQNNQNSLDHAAGQRIGGGGILRLGEGLVGSKSGGLSRDAVNTGSTS